MKSRLLRLAMLLLLMCMLWVGAAQAQAPDDCPAFVRVALESLDNFCGDTGRNQTCYGNVSIETTPREGIAQLNFSSVGDVINLGDMSVMELAGLDLSGEIWGVALFKVQANIPDTLPGQNVTFLMFGDVQVENLATDAFELPMTATGNVNIRLRPTTNANNIVASLARGQSVTANGVLADKSWVRIQVENVRNVSTGWVSADFLTPVEGSLDDLEVVTASEGAFGPMQAFYFSTGIGQPACRTAPEDGILIQTPKGIGRVNLNVNGVDVALGSTAYIHSGEGFFVVYLLDGSAILTFNGVRQFLPAGTFSIITTDEDGYANAPAQFPQPYDPDKFEFLPLDFLPEPIDPAPPVNPNQIREIIEEGEREVERQEQQAASGSDAITPGLWALTREIPPNECFGDSGTFNTTAFIGWNEEANTFTIEGLNMTRAGTGVFSFSRRENNGVTTFTLTFVNPTQFTGTTNSTIGECTYTGSISGQFVSPG